MSGGDYRSDWPTLRYDDKDYKVGPAKPKETKLEAPNPDVPPFGNRDNPMVKEATSAEYSDGIARRLQFLQSPILPDETN